MNETQMQLCEWIVDKIMDQNCRWFYLIMDETKNETQNPTLT